MWISSNFGQAILIEGAHQHGKFLFMIHIGLFHKKYKETRKNIPDIDDSNSAKVELPFKIDILQKLMGSFKK